MADRRKWSFLIPAAGSGTRAGVGPKVFLKLRGRTFLDWTVTKAMTISDDVVVALPAGVAHDPTSNGPHCRFIQGGDTRQETVKSLVENTNRDWIVIHDVARPFASTDLMKSVVDAAKETGAAAAFGPIDVPIAVISEGKVVGRHTSKEIGLFQSPLAFRREILVAAYNRAASRQEQSTIELVLAAGFEVRAVTGERNNIKITHPEDLLFARLLARQPGVAV